MLASSGTYDAYFDDEYICEATLQFSRISSRQPLGYISDPQLTYKLTYISKQSADICLVFKDTNAQTEQLWQLFMTQFSAVVRDRETKLWSSGLKSLRTAGLYELQLKHQTTALQNRIILLPQDIFICTDSFIHSFIHSFHEFI